jgi:hypothetical protein
VEPAFRGNVKANGEATIVSAVSAMYVSPLTVNLKSAATYALLAGSTITNTGGSVVKGDLGIYPGTSITGFPPATLIGTLHKTDGSALKAKVDLTAASVDAGSRPYNAVLTSDVGGQILSPGVYRSTSSLGVTGTLKLDCGLQQLNPVWIFQVVSKLVLATGAKVQFVNCALAVNPQVFWNVGSSATLQTTSEIVGTVMAYSSITAATGAKVTGALLARTAAVTMDTNAITRTGVKA